MQANSSGMAYETLRVWVATSDTLDFRSSEYKALATLTSSGKGKDSRESVRVPLPQGKNCAVFAEARYASGDREFSLSSPTRVFPK